MSDMSCTGFRPHLAAYNDGALSADLQAAVGAHLTNCRACRDVAARWRALRDCERRGAAVVVPAGLADQIAASLARERGGALRQRRSLGAGVLSAAALLLISVTLWKYGPWQPDGRIDGPLAPAFVTVSPARFAEFYDHCAGGGCDTYGAHDGAPAALRDTLPKQAMLPVALPDLSDRGYRVDGACGCLRCGTAHTVHVYYRKGADDSAPVSIFSVASLVRFKQAKLVEGGDVKRAYQQAVEHGVAILVWDGVEGSYVACAKMPPADLMDLVDSLDLSEAVGMPGCK
jgi:hypothetical protein